MQNLYREIRFNLTYEQANASIMREIKAYKKELSSNGINNPDALVKEKLKELDEFWFTWIKSPKTVK